MTHLPNPAVLRHDGVFILAEWISFQGPQAREVPDDVWGKVLAELKTTANEGNFRLGPYQWKWRRAGSPSPQSGSDRNPDGVHKSARH
jgi:hypothetical protein